VKPGWNQNMVAFGAGGIDYLDQIMLDYPGPGTSSRSARLVVWIKIQFGR
jgi:hypothetical protein